jgi:hypothetical protein
MLVLLSCGVEPLPPLLGRLEQPVNTDVMAGPGFTPALQTAGSHYGQAIAAFRPNSGGFLLAIGAPGANTITVYAGLDSDGGLVALQMITIASSPGLGSALAWGDFNGDGYVDLAAGAPTTPGDAGPGVGMVLVFKGLNGAIPLSGAPLHVLNPLAAPLGSDSHFGCSLAVAPSWNADAVDDLIVGACAGGTWVFAGGTAYLSPSPASSFVGVGGVAVASANLNNDAMSDLVTGNPTWTSNFITESGEVDWAFAPNSNSVAFMDPYAVAGAHLGAAFANLGNIDSTPGDEVAIGAPGLDGGDGEVRILTGGNGLSPWLEIPSSAPGGALGSSVAAVGDFDRDGWADLLVGAPGWQDSGAAWLYGTGSFINGTGQPPQPTLFISGAAPGARFGQTLASGIDLNGDGYYDLVIGAPGFSGDAQAVGVGRVYFVFGGPGVGKPPDAGVTSDAGVFDAGFIDGGMATDAGTNSDAGIKGHDAGTGDAGSPDAGSSDAGTPDAGASDAGVETDAGFNPRPPFDAGSPDASPLDFRTRACGCAAAGPGLLLPLLLVRARRRARAARGSSRTPAPRPAAPRRS